MKRLAAVLALSLTLAAYGALVASGGQETGVKQAPTLEDEAGFNCMTQGNYRSGPNPDLEDRR